MSESEAASGFHPLAGEPNPFGERPRGRPTHWEIPLVDFASERDLADRVLARLAPWFFIDREISGLHCSGRRLRIDAMLRPRQPEAWRDPYVAIGVEFKRPGDSTRDYTGWISQAVSYTHVDWDGYGRRIVLTCPGAASWLDTDRSVIDPTDRRDVFVAKKLTGQLGVGELVLRWGHGLTILLNGDRIWSERDGLSRGQHWGLSVRSGSR